MTLRIKWRAFFVVREGWVSDLAHGKTLAACDAWRGVIKGSDETLNCLLRVDVPAKGKNSGKSWLGLNFTSSEEERLLQLNGSSNAAGGFELAVVSRRVGILRVRGLKSIAFP